MWKQWLVAIVLMLPLMAEDRSKQMLTASQTARFNVSTAGSIRIENSFGEVDIEGWDRPEVEVTVVRSSEHYYEAQERAAAQRRMDSVQITTKQEGNDVIVSTVYPPLNAFRHPLSRRSDVEIRYSIHAPRASKLIINQNRGGVNASGLQGDIRATVINGQITLALADAKYAIDAQCKVGTVYSDFEGRDQRRHAIGEEFERQSEAPATNLYLRVRIGDIVILKRSGPPTG
jgi:hypothetical protein